MVNREVWTTGLVGQVIGGYQVESYIGGGNFSLVFEVTALATRVRLAMKVLGPWSDADAHFDFDSEGTLLQLLNQCSGVINWVESGTAKLTVVINGVETPLNARYHVMTLAVGTLEDIVLNPAARTALPWREKLRLWRGAITGVHQMHLSNIAHRDLKSSNCLITYSEGMAEVCITDLGRSTLFGAPNSAHPSVYAIGCGDTWYAPPEHIWIQGGCTDTDFRNADLYGLGSLFVELVTGHPMTALAVGSSHDTASRHNYWARDYASGRKRDLAMLRPRFHQAIENICLEIPCAIRQESLQLMRQLCDPVPTNRQPKSDERELPLAGGLHWLLRRAEILDRRLSIQQTTA